MADKKITVQDLTGTHDTPKWCPGCGDFTILSSVKMAIAELGLVPKDTVIISGIGCGSKTPHYVNVYGFEGLHGRPLPVATAIKLCNQKLNVIVIGGDGDSYGIGIAHLIHTMRRNMNITMVVQNNAVYGLTKGQTSPTSRKGFKSNSTPEGVIEEEVQPLSLAIASGATFVARANAMDIQHSKQLIMEGIKHRGFALIDIFQPCTTYNNINTAQWYREHTYKLDEKYNPTDKVQAFAKALEWDNGIPLGIIYKEEGKHTYGDDVPQIQAVPLVEQDISNVDISGYLEKFK